MVYHRIKTKWKHYMQQAHPSHKHRCDHSCTLLELMLPWRWRDIWEGYPGSSTGCIADTGSWKDLLEETVWDLGLTELKSAIVRGYFTVAERKTSGHSLASLHGVSSRWWIGTVKCLHSGTQGILRQGSLTSLWGTSGVTKTKECLRIRVLCPDLDIHTAWWSTYECEQLIMLALPSEPWKEVPIGFWGPTSTGEYLLLVTCKQSCWAEIQFVIFSSLGNTNDHG